MSYYDCFCIVLSNTNSVVFWFSPSWVHYVAYVWIVNFCLPLRCSLTFIYMLTNSKHKLGDMRFPGLNKRVKHIVLVFCFFLENKKTM